MAENSRTTNPLTRQREAEPTNHDGIGHRLNRNNEQTEQIDEPHTSLN
jgi:hypothetical protein